ncbi:MAG: hypothetical protein QOJ44_1261 [Acidimicrobiaceae bacterium]|jgi:hypothetical protein|nr:hypothetical protein [Acidimicrobiaceae bacterium]
MDEVPEAADRPTQIVRRASSRNEDPTLVASVSHRLPDAPSTTQIVPRYEPEPYRQAARPSDGSGPPGRYGTDPATVGPFDGQAIEGETFRTVFGSLLGVYTWECDRVPSVDEVHEAMEHRVQEDCAKLSRQPKHTRLAGWHGGWTTEGVGIFAADIWGLPRRGPSRHLGRTSLVVHTPEGRTLSQSQGIAC